jgi:hypothetical protein
MMKTIRSSVLNNGNAPRLSGTTQSRRRFEGRLDACREVATRSAGLPESPEGRALKYPSKLLEIIDD